MANRGERTCSLDDFDIFGGAERSEAFREGVARLPSRTPGSVIFAGGEILFLEVIDIHECDSA